MKKMLFWAAAAFAVILLNRFSGYGLDQWEAKSNSANDNKTANTGASFGSILPPSAKSQLGS